MPLFSFFFCIRINFFVLTSTLLFLPDFYGIIKVLLSELSRKVNRMSKKVTWTAVSNRDDSFEMEWK